MSFYRKLYVSCPEFLFCMDSRRKFMAGVGSATIASTLGIGSASAETEYQKEPHEEEREILKKGGVKQLEKYARKKKMLSTS